MHVCFDIDGTLCEVGADVDFDDASSILQHTRPNHAALGRLLKLREAGHTVSFVTGRGMGVQSATNKQLKLWLGSSAGVDVMHRDFEPYEMMGTVLYKMDALRYLRPDIYVGDLPMDQTAAAASGVAFMPAEWFAKGHSFDVLNPDFAPAAVAKRGIVTRLRIEDFNTPAGAYDCVTCGNRIHVAAGLLPAICDACGKLGPWRSQTVDHLQTLQKAPDGQGFVDLLDSEPGAKA